MTRSAALHCDFSGRASDASKATTSVNVFECCGLKFNFFIAKLEKNQFSQPAPALANNIFNLPKAVELEKNSRSTAFSYRVPAIARRDLHLKNCVFRI